MIHLLLQQGAWPPWLQAAVAAGVLFLILHFVWTALRRRARPRIDSRVDADSPHPAQEVTDDLRRTIAELEDLMRHFSEKLDAKAVRLQELLDEADRRIDRLGPASAADPLTQKIYDLSDAGRDPLQIARQLNEQVGKVELILALRDAAGAADES